jgi:hypothetical protein
MYFVAEAVVLTVVKMLMVFFWVVALDVLVYGPHTANKSDWLFLCCVRNKFIDFLY